MAPPRAKSPKLPQRNWIPIIAMIGVVLIGLAFFFFNSNSSPSQEKGISEEVHYSPIKACHVFIENSGSMDAYMQPANSQLKSDLNALVSQIQSLGETDTLMLNYINSLVIPIQGVRKTSDFFEGLSVASFRQAGGNRANTSLRDLLNAVYEQTGVGEVSILVSDMILDLKSGQSPESVSTNIETDLREQLAKRPDWSVVVWRMLSDYEGKYYHRSGVAPTQLRGVKRPYYIFFFGDRTQLRSILADKRLPDNMPLWQNRRQFLSLEPTYTNFDYYVAPQATLGSIKLERSDRKSHTIAQAERGTSADGKSGLGFEIVMKQRPEILQSLEELTTSSNYEVNPKEYQVVRILSQGKGLKLRLESNSVLRGEIRISYRQSMPSWFEQVHCEQNDNIHAEGAMDQTYGIRYILEGLRRPYETQAKHLMNIPIRIN